MDILIILLICVLVVGIVSILFVIKFDKAMSIKESIIKKYKNKS